MKILLHDYAGHPFQAELSRRLALRGHTVIHAYFGADSGPKGRMEKRPEDPESLTFAPLATGGAYSKTNFFQRRSGDLAYGRAFARLISETKPDIVLSGNTPTEAQEFVPPACQAADARFVYWCQDFYSIAATNLLQRKLPGPGHLIGAWYRFLERRQMQAAEHTILITDAFRAQTERWGIDDNRISVIPNWGALEEIPVTERSNAWAAEHGLGGNPVALYTGTLALKHDPGLLIALADGGSMDVVVVAAGIGVEQLEKSQSAANWPNLHLLPLQPFERFAEVLGSADVLLAVIEREAGEFSVPSKVLSYLCAGRPIVLSAPSENLAARIVETSGAGRVVEPGDTAGFVAAARNFIDDPAAAKSAGLAGRAYAEANFDLDAVAARFEAVMDRAMANPVSRRI